MKKEIAFILLTFLVIGMLFQFPLVLANDNNDSETMPGSSDEIEEIEDDGEVEVNVTINGKTIKIKVRGAVAERVRAAIANRNRLQLNTSELPENCQKTGSVIKCNIDGGKVMAIMAGNSGNTIVKVQGVNMTTRSELYHHNGKLYGIFEDNETRAIEYLPDQVREIVRARIQAQIEGNETIELNEEGEYEVEVRKRAKLLGIFAVKEKVKFHVDPETGEIIRQRGPWWGFLATDVEEETNSTE